jgi:hypothetical protein
MGGVGGEPPDLRLQQHPHPSACVNNRPGPGVIQKGQLKKWVDAPQAVQKGHSGIFPLNVYEIIGTKR